MTDEETSGGRPTRWGVLRTVGTMTGVAVLVAVGAVAIRPDADTVTAEERFEQVQIERAVPIPAQPVPPDIDAPPALEGEVGIETLVPVPEPERGGGGLITIVASTTSEAHGQLVLTAWADADEELCLHAPPMGADQEALCGPPPTTEHGLGLIAAWGSTEPAPGLTCVAGLLPVETVSFTVEGEEIGLEEASLEGQRVKAALRCWDEERTVGTWEAAYADGSGEGVSR